VPKLGYNAPEWLDQEIQAVSAATGCGVRHLKALVREEIDNYVHERFGGKVLGFYRDYLAERDPQEVIEEVETKARGLDDDKVRMALFGGVEGVGV